mmetsp:Transcript_38355/g.82994  ORF Transcript_38355/g.82994 Transcript_38355/m.82994 type:complete len:1187 (-) Transcript_38355:253-3813(-)
MLVDEQGAFLSRRRQRCRPVRRSRCYVLSAVLIACAVLPTTSAVFPALKEPEHAAICDVDAVQEANFRQLHPILEDLVNRTFMRLFHVRLKSPKCAYWGSQHDDDNAHGEADSGSCTGSVPTQGGGLPFGKGSSIGKSGQSFFPPPACSIDGEEGSGGAGARFEATKVDHSMTKAERKASDEAFEVRKLEGSDTCEEDLPGYFADLCNDEPPDSLSEDVNLIKNPERNTGYNGSHIWQAMYSENCFEVGSGLPRGRFGESLDMCYEEMVLYRLLSGWHASTTISIAKNFYAPGSKGRSTWAPNPEHFMRSLGRHPERLKNLHFSFVVVLRAIKKAGPYLQAYPYTTGDKKEDELTKSLVERFLQSQVLSVCSPLFDAFDETRLFQGSSEHRSQLKRQFKSVFRNITEIVDCVQCQRCRLHAKLFSLGLGAALKILLTPTDMIGQAISRNEVVSLWNVVWKLADSIVDAKYLADLHWQAKDSNSGSSTTSSSPSSSAPSPPASDSWLPPLPPVGGNAASPQLSLTEADRLGLLDLAVGAVKKASRSGAAEAVVEEKALKSLATARPVSDAVLLIAKHYAVENPGLFTRVLAESGASAEAAPAAASAPALLGSPNAAPADAIIIGGGLAGMVAAISMLDRGGTVVMIEKQNYLGGNSGKASSGINAALETSVESLVRDTTRSAGGLARPDLINKLAEDSAPAVDWLRNRVSVDLSMRSQLGGHSVKRTLRPANAFVGAEITFAAGQVLKQAADDTPDQFRLMLNTKWTGLKQVPNGWQVLVNVDGKKVAVEARSVLIASGGFGHDAKEFDSYMLKHRPDLKDFPTTLGPQTTGDGLKIARTIGAKLIDMDKVQLHPTGFVDPQKPDDETKTLAAELLRGVGGLLLDRFGHRFTDELTTRQAVVNRELAATSEGRDFTSPLPPRSFALVLNSKAAAVADRHVTLYSKKGLLEKVSGVEGLAAHLNVSADTLRETFEAYNKASAVGKDEFNRTVFPAHLPVEDDEDFYVGFIVPVIHYTMGGIAIDTEARVLGEDGKPLPGLYAAGEASGGVHGDNRLAGNSLLECTVFGRHVGKTLPVGGTATVSAPKTKSAAPLQIEKASQSGEAEEALRAISAEELGQHKNLEQRTWVALYGKVYDLTDYIEEHPGGENAILDVAGTDGTDHFESVHNQRLLDSMGFEPIGTLATSR